MPKVIIGKVLAGFEPVENPAWNTAYMRKKHVTRRSMKVKAINVCFIGRKLLGEPLPAPLAKERFPEEWARPPEGRKMALSKAAEIVLSECKANPEKYCRVAASRMGLKVDECIRLLGSINVRAAAAAVTGR